MVNRWVSVVAAWVVCAHAAGQSFAVLDSVMPGGQRAVARGVSGNGMVIVGGSADNFNIHGVYWRQEAGEWVRRDLPGQGANNWSRGVAASYDGDTIVGIADDYLTGSLVPGTPAAWTGVLSGNPVLVTPLDDGPPETRRRGTFNGVSADGTIVAGYTANVQNPALPFEAWRGGPSTPSLISPAGSTYYASTPFGGGNTLSADGSVFVGSRYPQNGTKEAFRWSESGFTVLQRPANSPWPGAVAEAVSADGRVIGGILTSDQGNVYNGGGVPILWRDLAPQTLPLVSGRGSSGRVLALSGDGSLAGGVQHSTVSMPVAFPFTGTTAVVWTNNGTTAWPLNTFLASHGITVQGVTLNYVMGISHDGRTLVGIGTDAQGQAVGWVATIPTPGVVVLLGLAACRRRRAAAT